MLQSPTQMARSLKLKHRRRVIAGKYGVGLLGYTSAHPDAWLMRVSGAWCCQHSPPTGVTAQCTYNY